MRHRSEIEATACRSAAMGLLNRLRHAATGRASKLGESDYEAYRQAVEISETPMGSLGSRNGPGSTFSSSLVSPSFAVLELSDALSAAVEELPEEGKYMEALMRFSKNKGQFETQSQKQDLAQLSEMAMEILSAYDRPNLRPWQATNAG